MESVELLPAAIDLRRRNESSGWRFLGSRLSLRESTCSMALAAITILAHGTAYTSLYTTRTINAVAVRKRKLVMAESQASVAL
jgi:hypothetical protein